MRRIPETPKTSGNLLRELRDEGRAANDGVATEMAADGSILIA